MKRKPEEVKASHKVELPEDIQKRIRATVEGFTPYQYDKHLKEMYGSHYD